MLKGREGRLPTQGVLLSSFLADHFSRLVVFGRFIAAVENIQFSARPPYFGMCREKMVPPFGLFLRLTNT